MSIVDGSPVNASTTNAQKLDKVANDTATGIISLANTDPSSGASIANVQGEINDQAADIATNTADIASLDSRLDIVEPIVFGATSANTASAIVKRGTSGEFAAGQVTMTKALVLSGASNGLDVSAAGALPIGASVGANNLTLGGSTSTVVVAGNLQVNGSTTTVSSATLNVADSNITVNKGGNDASSEGAGLTVERTGTSGSFIYKNTSGSKFAIGALGAEADVVNTTATQPLTNKTISGSSNTLSNIADGSLSTSYVKADGTRPLTGNWAAGAFSITANSVAVGSAANKISGVSTLNNGGDLSLPTSADTLVGRATTDTLTNKTLTAPVISTIVNTGTLTLPTSTDTLVGRATTDTLTNKTLTAPVISTISNTGTLTLPTTTDTLVGRATTDTLTNKTLTSPVISTISNTGTLTLPTTTDTLVGRATTDTLTNKTISGASNTLSNIADGSLSTSYLKADGTRALTGNWSAGAFSITANSVVVGSAANKISGVSTLNNGGDLALPTSADTLVGRATTDTLTNKTLTSPVISSISNTGTLTLPTTTDTLVGRATTDTLSNKTLTSPIISTISNTGTLTLPTSTDTLVGRATTDSLTNKTFADDLVVTKTNVSPAYLKVQSSQSGQVRGAQFIDTGNAKTNWLIAAQNTTDNAFEINYAAAGSTSWQSTAPVVVNGSGNILISGTITSNSANGNFIRHTNTTNTSGFDVGLLGGSGSANAYVYNRSNAAIVFGTNNSESARIDSSGRLGVGLNTLAYRISAMAVSGSSNLLFLANSDYVSSSTGSGLGIATTANSGSTSTQINAFISGGASSGNLLLNAVGGKVGIGSTSAPASTLDVTGTASVSSDTTLGGKFIVTNGNAPATSTSTGTTGQIAWDSGFIYVCVATNSWKRVALTTF